MSKADPAAAIAAVLAGGRALNVSDLADELIGEMGGPKEFAHFFVTELKSGTAKGSVSRARMLDGILRLVGQASSQNKELRKPEDKMDTAELEVEARHLLGKAGKAREAADGPPA